MNCTRMIWKKRINLYYSYTPGPWPHLPCREWGYCWPSVEILKIPINKSAKIVFCKNVCIKYTNFRITVLDEWCKTFRVIFPFWLLMKIVDKLPTRYFFFGGGGAGPRPAIRTQVPRAFMSLELEKFVLKLEGQPSFQGSCPCCLNLFCLPGLCSCPVFISVRTEGLYSRYDWADLYPGPCLFSSEV